jgi:hypothetical protein
VAQPLTRSRTLPHPAQLQTAQPHPVQPRRAQLDSAQLDSAQLRSAVVALAEPTPRRLVEFVVDELTLDPTTLALAAARADVVRLRFSSALPSHVAVHALVAMLGDEIAALGRARTDVRIVLEVETVVADDEADAARRRANLAYTAAFSHVSWSPESTWVVAPLDAVADAARALAARTGVDAVELVLVGRSRESGV